MIVAPLLALCFSVLVSGAAGEGEDGGAGDGERPGPLSREASPWYLERGVERREPGDLDDLPEVLFELAELLRDGAVPGFYDGQFAAFQGEYEQLARIAADHDIHQQLRIMAVMAIQEIETGRLVAEALEPLVIPADIEYLTDESIFHSNGVDPDDEAAMREALIAELSKYARYALGKDGQPAAVLAMIEELQLHAQRDIAETLDPSIDTDVTRDVGVQWRRQLLFDIGYLYQQLDDYANAAVWFHKLTENLPGHRITRMAHYNLACIAALTDRPALAVEHLEAAFEVGFVDVAWLDEDGDLDSLRERDDFRALRARMIGGEGAPGARRNEDG